MVARTSKLLFNRIGSVAKVDEDPNAAQKGWFHCSANEWFSNMFCFSGTMRLTAIFGGIVGTTCLMGRFWGVEPIHFVAQLAPVPLV